MSCLLGLTPSIRMQEEAHHEHMKKPLRVHQSPSRLGRKLPLCLEDARRVSKAFPVWPLDRRLQGLAGLLKERPRRSEEEAVGLTSSCTAACSEQTWLAVGKGARRRQESKG